MTPGPPPRRARPRRAQSAQPVTWAVVAGGGTAGHVLPGLCIGDEIVRRGVPADAVHFVGSSRGVETRLIPEGGFSLTALAGRGLQRRLTAANAAAAAGLALAFLQSVGLMLRRRPAVVVGLGGYASAACGAAAVLLRIPLVITEQNAVPGLANRLLSRFAKTAATAFKDTEIRGANWTGNPVRTEILSLDRAATRSAARAALGVRDGCRLVAVVGGSLGARRINHSVTAALAGPWAARSDLHVRHIAGSRNFPSCNPPDATTDKPAADNPADTATDKSPSTATDNPASHSPPNATTDKSPGTTDKPATHNPATHNPAAGRPAGPPIHDLVPYEDDMARLYAAADLVVSRAGATTVAELAAVGAPAVLVPLPGAPGDHQTANARRLAQAGAAVVVEDGLLDGDRLASEVDALLKDPERLAEMGQAGRSLARPDAASALVDLAEAAARRPPPRGGPQTWAAPTPPATRGRRHPRRPPRGGPQT